MHERSKAVPEGERPKSRQEDARSQASEEEEMQEIREVVAEAIQETKNDIPGNIGGRDSGGIGSIDSSVGASTRN